MSQLSLIHDSLEEALGDVVNALGGAKSVGASLRPDLAPEAAARWLKDCLNDSRREMLHPGQIVWLLREGRAAGVHSAMAYLADACGYADPVPVEPADARAELQRQYIDATARLVKMAERIEKLGAAR